MIIGLVQFGDLCSSILIIFIYINLLLLFLLSRWFLWTSAFSVCVSMGYARSKSGGERCIQGRLFVDKLGVKL